MADFLCGLDLGQSGDYTALSILRRSMALTEAGLPRRALSGDLMYRFDCVYLKRYHLGTSYPEIVSDVKIIVERSPLLYPSLVIDATGVGRAVIDIFLNEDLKCHITPLTITAGDNVRKDRWNITSTMGYWTPKTELVSSLRACLESRRLKVAPLELADTLKRELIDYRVKITKSASEVFEARQGSHDDLVLSLALPIWYGERRECWYATAGYADVGPNLEDAAPLSAEAKIEKESIIKESHAVKDKERTEWDRIDHDHWWDTVEDVDDPDRTFGRRYDARPNPWRM